MNSPTQAFSEYPVTVTVTVIAVVTVTRVTVTGYLFQQRLLKKNEVRSIYAFYAWWFYFQ